MAVLGVAAATYLTNADFGGVTGVTVTTNGPGSANTSSPGWYQFTVVPGGTLSTTLAPSTEPAGGGNEIHVVTDSGDYAPAEQGNGFGQSFIAAWESRAHVRIARDKGTLESRTFCPAATSPKRNA